MTEDLEALAARLEASGQYQVLRKLAPRPSIEAVPAGTRIGLVLDVETTGSDHRSDEVIELAMARFAYTPEGEVLGVHETFQGYHEPSKPIPPEITALTGLDAAKVAGCKLDEDAVGAFIAPAVIILAHNAAFDRRFAERLHPYFSTKPWGCSMSEPPWREEGFEGLKLTYIAAQCGFFYDKHRALHDCMAMLEILARPLPSSGRPALAALLERARRPMWRLWAENAPFEHKGRLKARGYRWSGGDDGRPRAWWVDVDEAGRPARSPTFTRRSTAARSTCFSVGSLPTIATRRGPDPAAEGMAGVANGPATCLPPPWPARISWTPTRSPSIQTGASAPVVLAG